MESVRTSRLVVRRFREADLADYMGYQALPEVRRYMPGQPMDEAAGVRFLARMAALRGDERGVYHAFAVEHVADGRVIGDVGVFLQTEPPGEGDVGFQFHPDYHGKGYAGEAAGALLRHFFAELELERVTSGCDAANVASYRLMECLGMKREAQDTPSESCRYALSRQEWIDSIDGALSRRGFPF